MDLPTLPIWVIQILTPLLEQGDRRLTEVRGGDHRLIFGRDLRRVIVA